MSSHNSVIHVTIPKFWLAWEHNKHVRGKSTILWELQVLAQNGFFLYNPQKLNDGVDLVVEETVIVASGCLWPYLQPKEYMIEEPSGSLYQQSAEIF